MEDLNESAAAQIGQEQTSATLVEVEQSSQAIGSTQSDAADSAQGGSIDVANADDVSTEHPLDIIAEIEHLLRIVGNFAVHEFRRITERLADLKNHPAIKPGE
ncbi:hypothetical protein [Burkholderia sp. IDO3]|uniref:hypothetical protein n=1 Tax=Burkholderia sp. IDO3 TaxID=1705310 RepID=UPI000BBAA38B|nr:hypothetical protein [Burkholderia sp. IDO3]AXK61526.1 hypothetical protein DCN14_01820 [Burkholderia sp. IDO3]PCD58178.1 hypothetical protein CN645_30300 [Burkholderia sp. IDO3]